MPKPRRSLISLEATSYYHCISRCVRRAFLCDEDGYTGRSFEHRRGWIEERLLELAQTFAIEVYGYSRMASHSHLVLHVDQALPESWTTQEVVERWHQLFGSTVLSERYLGEEVLLEVEQQQVKDLAETWRERLTSVSWLLTQRRGLNEHIARKANDEDQCTGHFWEGRFSSPRRCSTSKRCSPVSRMSTSTPPRRHRRDARGLRLHLHPAADSHAGGSLQSEHRATGDRRGRSSHVTDPATRAVPLRRRGARGHAGRSSFPPGRLPGAGQLDRSGGARGQARRHRRRSAAAVLRAHRDHPGGLAAAGQGLRDSL
jgi:hypothetical protein